MNHILKKILFAVFMSFVTCGLVVIVVVLVNEGYSDVFWNHWWKSFRIGYFVVLLSILFIAPLIQKAVEKIVNKK